MNDESREYEVIETTVSVDGGEPVTVDTHAGLITMSVSFRDGIRTNLFIHEVTTLVDEMRVMASPHAERLEHALDRWLGGGDDDQDTLPADEVPA